MTINFNDYKISDDLQRVDFKKVTSWLATVFWSPGIGQEEVEKGARNSSLVIGCYSPDGAQVGFARLASDKTRFGYFMDVFVDPAHRHKGIAQAMIRFGLEHPDHQSVYQWTLATRDAHKVYEKVGFRSLPHPERWMGFFKKRPGAES
jgi:GNAT superfamily N-acetyltransferase